MKNMRSNKHWLTAVLLSLIMTVTGVCPALAADATAYADGTAAQMSAVTTTVNTSAEKTSPTYDPVLARRVRVTLDVMKDSQTTKTGLKKKVTREQLAKMLVQLSPYKNKVGTTVKTSMYADVKRTSAYAPYIKIAVKNGWMKGNLQGKFRPKQAVTLQESVSAVLAMLGYSDSDFQGNLSSAKMSFYKAQKLNKNIKKKAKDAMTCTDMSCLLYNMLVTANKSGSIYGRTIDLSLDANGDVAYLPLVYDEQDGPVIAQADWKDQIPFRTDNATIYIDGSKSDASNIHEYDVLYYSKKLKSIFV